MYSREKCWRETQIELVERALSDALRPAAFWLTPSSRIRLSLSTSVTGGPSDFSIDSSSKTKALAKSIQLAALTTIVSWA